MHCQLAQSHPCQLAPYRVESTVSLVSPREPAMTVATHANYNMSRELPIKHRKGANEKQ